MISKKKNPPHPLRLPKEEGAVVKKLASLREQGSRGGERAITKLLQSCPWCDKWRQTCGSLTSWPQRDALPYDPYPWNHHYLGQHWVADC